MTYHAKPNYIQYDEWFDNNVDPFELEYEKEKKFSDSVHEMFYKMSKHNFPAVKISKPRVSAVKISKTSFPAVKISKPSVPAMKISKSSVPAVKYKNQYSR